MAAACATAAGARSAVGPESRASIICAVTPIPRHCRRRRSPSSTKRVACYICIARCIAAAAAHSTRVPVLAYFPPPAHLSRHAHIYALFITRRRSVGRALRVLRARSFIAALPGRAAASSSRRRPTLRRCDGSISRVGETIGKRIILYIIIVSVCVCVYYTRRVRPAVVIFYIYAAVM